MATETLETLLPGSMKVGRLLYAEHTDTLIRATGEKPGTRPGVEYVPAAVSDQGLVNADNSVTQSRMDTVGEDCWHPPSSIHPVSRDLEACDHPAGSGAGSALGDRRPNGRAFRYAARIVRQQAARYLARRAAFAPTKAHPPCDSFGRNNCQTGPAHDGAKRRTRATGPESDVKWVLSDVQP